MMNPIDPRPIAPIQAPVIPSQNSARVTAGSLSFGQVLEANLAKGSELKFSAHAQQRLTSRNIQLDQQDLARLNKGVAQAAAKGSRESLLLKDDLAFVVSVPNYTVITAVDTHSARENVFTNIDSAVIV